jgi:Trypsin-like peptidase domain
MKRLLSLVTALLLAAMPILASQEVDLTKMSKAHQNAYNAALALYGTSGDVTHFLCSTTVVAQRKVMNASGKHEYLLLTAGHCITGDGLPEDLKFGVREQIAEDSPKPDLQPVDVIKAENDAKYDFAILYLASDKVYPIIEIDFDTIPQIEDKVYDVNFSLGLVKQVALGVVATNVMDTQTSDGSCDICKGRYMVHIFAGPGASGSAIISEKTNKIVGVGELGFPGTTTGLGVETTKALKEWLDAPSASNLSPKDQSLQSKVAE